MSRLDFDIAVFAVNDAATIGACIQSTDRACSGKNAHISVLLNGTTDNTIEILRDIRPTNAALTVYWFPAADKANAINHFLYELRREARLHICVDAYTRIVGASFRAMAASIEADPKAMIASALPVGGRSAKSVAANTMKGGMVNGLCYGLRPDFVHRMVEAGFRLPLQLYRVDGLLGSMGAHDLDSMNTIWDDTRLIGVEDARFALKPLSIFKMDDIRRQYNWEIRQARGRMENAAIKLLIYAGGYGALPDNANHMIRNWMMVNRPSSRTMREKYFMNMAVRQLLHSKDLKASQPEIIPL